MPHARFAPPLVHVCVRGWLDALRCVQVSLNLNVLLRSATQAAMVLAFMAAASWRLTVVTFILVPLVMAISKVRARHTLRAQGQ